MLDTGEGARASRQRRDGKQVSFITNVTEISACAAHRRANFTDFTERTATSRILLLQPAAMQLPPILLTFCL